MFDYIYKDATYLSTHFFSFIIANGNRHEEWIVGSSDKEKYDFSMEALDKREASRLIDLLVEQMNLKVDVESTEGKYVYLKKIK